MPHLPQAMRRLINLRGRDRMRRLILLCLSGLSLSAAVAVASPVIGHPAAVTWFAGAGHIRKASTRRSRKPQKRRPSPLNISRGRVASAATVAVLFGDQTIESGRASTFPGLAKAFPFTNSSSGSATSINVYLRNANQATTLIAGLYADNGGRPGALDAVGSLTSPKPGTWNSVPIRSTRITPGTYWVAVLPKGGTLSFRERAQSACTSQRSSGGHLVALPTSWAPGTTESGCPVSAYVDGTLTPSSTDSGGSSSTTTTATTTPDPITLPPVNTGAPTISGDAVDGDTLTSSNGSWADSPTSYTYQWQGCATSTLGLVCDDIVGATGSSYTLTKSDVGSAVRVVVTGANSAGSTSATSVETAVVTLPPAPANTAVPLVSGSAVLGQTLTTSNGSWSGSPTSYAYQWQDCNGSGGGCVSISGASSSSYALTSADVGHTIRAVVTATNDGGSNTASSAQTAVVTTPPPANTGAPTISGSAVQGQA